jgi:hypothetical protein
LDPKAVEARLRASISTLSSLEDRSPGTPGHREAAAFVEQSLSGTGIEAVDRFSFPLAIRRHVESRIDIPGKGSIPLRPFFGKACPGRSSTSETAAPSVSTVSRLPAPSC